MTKRVQTKAKKVDEKALKGLREGFVKIIPQLEDIERTQQQHERILEKGGRKIYPYIDTQSFSTIHPPQIS